LPVGYKFGRETTLLKAGTTYPPAALPLPADISKERDVPVTLRDGTVIYVDIFRPASESKNLPAIVSWTPYGKTTPTAPVGDVPPEWFSGQAVFEGADAGFFASHGYVVVNVDVRGAGESGGDIPFWGSVDAWDGHDVVEWVAAQEWSNGKVATYGASWLAISQWFIAATRPPHLTAIVPWNGFSDYYRDSLVWGGIPDTEFAGRIAQELAGRHLTERPDLMAHNFPLLNDYWNDKRARLEEIEIPAYVVADGLAPLHPMGSIEGYRRISSSDKWLRINGTQEWYDQYDPQNERDLLRFLDHYLKDAQNGWEKTPRVRATVLDAGGTSKQASFDAWPAPDTRYERLYLDAASGSLSTSAAPAGFAARYPAKTGQATFTFTFTEDTQLIGYMKARLYVEADGADDMDLFIAAEKLDADGMLLTPTPDTLPAWVKATQEAIGEVGSGAPGRLRVSLRELDPGLTTPFVPVQCFTRRQPLSPGQIVPVDIALVPRAYYFHAGQQLRLVVAGFNIRSHTVPTINDGRHIIHTGSQHRSYLQVPVVPLR
jgi:hypothetical protein